MADTVQHKRELLCSQVQGVVSSFYLYLSFSLSLSLPSFNLLLYGNCNPIGCHVQQLGLVIGDKNGTERHNRLPCYSALRQVTMLPRAVQQVCCLSLFLYTPVCVCVCVWHIWRLLCRCCCYFCLLTQTNIRFLRSTFADTPIWAYTPIVGYLQSVQQL